MTKGKASVWVERLGFQSIADGNVLYSYHTSAQTLDYVIIHYANTMDIMTNYYF